MVKARMGMVRYSPWVLHTIFALAEWLKFKWVLARVPQDSHTGGIAEVELGTSWGIPRCLALWFTYMGEWN